MLHGDLEVCVMKQKKWRMEIVDPTGKLRLNAIGAPSGNWFIQKHLPSGNVHAHSELNRPALLQPLVQRCVRISEQQVPGDPKTAEDEDEDAETCPPHSRVRTNKRQDHHRYCEGRPYSPCF